MMDIKKTISSITVSGKKDLEGRDFRTQRNIALDEVCSQAGFDVQKDADGTNVTATLPWGDSVVHRRHSNGSSINLVARSGRSRVE